MKILCLIESLVSGGAERQIAGLASLLKGRGHEVAVWTYYPQDFYRKQLDEAGVGYRCVAKARNKLVRIPVLLREARQWKPDAVIAYLPSVTKMACLMKMFGLKSKLIVSERNSSQRYGLTERIRFFLYRLETDWVVPNSHMQERFIKEHCPGLTNRVRTITNLIDTDFFSPTTKPKDEKLLRMVCAARVIPQKNVFRFIDSVADLRNRGVQLKIDWFGCADGIYAEQCLEKIMENDLTDMIEFRGVTNDIRDEYRKADVFCLPSLREGFPNVICEAMSCGLPVLCSRVCDNADIVMDGVSGLMFDPNDKSDITDKITTFIQMSCKDRKLMGDAGRQRALELFSREHFINAYEDLLK